MEAFSGHVPAMAPPSSFEEELLTMMLEPGVATGTTTTSFVGVAVTWMARSARKVFACDWLPMTDAIESRAVWAAALVGVVMTTVMRTLAASMVT